MKVKYFRKQPLASSQLVRFLRHLERSLSIFANNPVSTFSFRPSGLQDFGGWMQSPIAD